jgi:4,5-dihydroxyphthalate decarboxylase
LSKNLHLTLACAGYDRTRGLQDGSVRAAGIDLTYLQLPVEETFFRMLRFREFDVAEMSLSSYLLSLDEKGQGPFVALPVFPSRAFRHNGIYVNQAGGVQTPADLVGRTVGVPEYQVTAAVWIRGILQEHHGVPIESVRYRTGGLHEPGRVEKLALNLPPDVDVAPIPAGRTLSDLLATGELDAVYSPRTPRSFADGAPGVGRLFEDYRQVEIDYFRRTGIFPIMHVVVLRRETYERDRWVARSLQVAFEQARLDTLSGIDETAALRYMLPWLQHEVEATREVMGADFWSYGVEQNLATIETAVRYSHEQGLARRRFTAEELFAPETLERVLV